MATVPNESRGDFLAIDQPGDEVIGTVVSIERHERAKWGFHDEDRGTSFVYVRTGPEVFERRDVVLGTREANRASILSGLQPGDEVVTEGGFKLKAEHARLAGGGT